MAHGLYWRKTRRLTFGLLVIWVFVTFVLAGLYYVLRKGVMKIE